MCAARYILAPPFSDIGDRSVYSEAVLDITLDIFDERFYNIVSKEDSNIGFVSISPFEIKTDYEIDLDDEFIKELDIKDEKDVLVICLITLGKSLKDSTANLKAPIIINIKNNRGKQLILQDDKYKIKEPLE